MLVLGIDPSINRTGLAWYDGEDFNTFLIKTKGKNLERKTWSLVSQLSDYLYSMELNKMVIDKVIIEKPASWTRFHKNINSVVKLNIAYITLYTTIVHRLHISPIPKKAPTIHSGLPTKERARYILKSYLPNADSKILDKMDNNEVDALMLAVWGYESAGVING